jgi:hypothetical protein
METFPELKRNGTFLSMRNQTSLKWEITELASTTIDGDDSETKTVNECYVCFFHGCASFYTKDAFNRLARKLMRELYDNIII